MSFYKALALLFITLKLCSVIIWPWWLVLLPFGIGVILRVAKDKGWLKIKWEK